MKLLPKFSNPKPYGFGQEDTLCETCDPQGGASFDPGAIICRVFEEVYKRKLHGKFGNPRPYGFGKEVF